MSEEEKDNVNSMGYNMKDPNTGEVKHYEVSYSQKLQQEIDEELKKSNKLKRILIILMVVSIIIGALIVFKTGTIGALMRRAMCPVCGG